MFGKWLIFALALSGCEIDDGKINGPYCTDERFSDDPCKCYNLEESPDCPYDDTGDAE
jgi:hypothetical protein